MEKEITCAVCGQSIGKIEINDKGKPVDPGNLATMVNTHFAGAILERNNGSGHNDKRNAKNQRFKIT